MKPDEITVRFDGAEVNAPNSVSLSPGGVAGLGFDKSTAKFEDKLFSQFGTIRDPAVLRELKRRFPGHAISAGMLVPGQDAFFLGAEAQPVLGATAGDLQISCGIRLFTSSVLLDHVASGNCSLDTSVAEILEIPAVQGTSSDRLLVRDLLNHRHGLEDEGVNSKEFLGDGWIDEDSMVAAFARNAPRFKPGWHYSYSKAGYWLAGAILQRLEKRSFARIVSSRGIKVMGNVCPAGGGGCRIPREGLLQFLQHRMQRGREGGGAPVSPSASTVTAMPGWSPYEKGIQLGWKLFLGGWLGHNSMLPNRTGMIRVHPDSGAALFLWVPKPIMMGVGNHLFGSILPELVTPDLPGKLSAEAWRVKDKSRYIGEFAAEGKSLKIVGTDQDGLSAVLDKGVNAVHERHVQMKFAPRTHDIFLATMRTGWQFPYIQFLSSPGGAIEALWSGVKVWPKVSQAK